jgi:hypothetical protein
MISKNTDFLLLLLVVILLLLHNFHSKQFVCFSKGPHFPSSAEKEPDSDTT